MGLKKERSKTVNKQTSKNFRSALRSTSEVFDSMIVSRTLSQTFHCRRISVICDEQKAARLPLKIKPK